MKKNLSFLSLLFLFLFIVNLNNSDMDIKNKDNSVIEKSEHSDDLFFDYYDEAEKIMEDMTMEDKISQLFLMRYNTRLYGNDLSYLGGVTLYGSFFKIRDKKEVLEYINDLNSKSAIDYAIAVDEEGGTVARISSQKQFRDNVFLSPQKLFEKGGIDLILEVEDEKDALLKSLNINLNLAPVADVSVNKNDFMNDRTLGVDPVTTAEYIKRVTLRAKENGLSTCLKHFPGYGNNKDTHANVVKDMRKLEYMQENDFLPFLSGIEAGSPFIMVSHNILVDVDELYPSSLSSKVIDILKKDLNYSGIILSDDISMVALYEYQNEGNAAVLALNAGNDMIMTSSYPQHYKSILDAYKIGEVSEQRINYSVRKIIAWKIAYGIIKEG